MPETSPTLSLPYLQPAQAQKHVTHNEALRILDAVTQLSVLTASLATPPELPDEGDRYIVAIAATGEWAGKDHNIAVWCDNTWQFFEPSVGWRADDATTGAELRFDGTSWVSPAAPTLQNVPLVGIGTTADTTNRLAVSADATLLNNAGAGHQLKLNKSAVSDTSSLLFQTGFSGRAEMGTTGSDDFAIKVSADGTTFRTALSVDANVGAVQFPTGQTYFQEAFILNDTAWSFIMPWSNPARIMLWLSLNMLDRSYLMAVTGDMTGARNFAEIFASPAASLNFLDGPLTGTSGPDGELNMSIDNAGGVRRMYIENRLGSNRLFTLSTMGK
ncbi:MAG: DUF2793 domain-containing protein [Sulfitobacter sp.]